MEFYEKPDLDDIFHYGILGMKWGKRKAQGSSSREEKKAAKQLKKAQKKWDKNVNRNWTKAYNKAAGYANEVLIPKMNKKYEKYDFSNSKDPKVAKIIEKYNKEYETQFNEVLQMKYDEMFGKRPE